MAVPTWYCNVTVANVWTSPDSVRPQDEPSMSNPARPREWLGNLSLADRLELSEENRIQTQLVYGEPVIVDEMQGDWARVCAVWQTTSKDSRGYPGWVPLRQLKQAQPISAEGFAKVTAGKAQLWNPDGSPSLVLPFNVILPYWYVLDGEIHVCTPEGDGILQLDDVELAPSVHQFLKLPVETAVERGLAFLDLPYLWGGTSSYGYDCSGFTYSMYKACGHFIPRDAADQARQGIAIPTTDPSNWQTGDLLFFASDEGQGNIRHVGFYYGDGLLFHAPSTGKSIEIIKLAGTPYERELCAVRRLGFDSTK
ncbi:C40 family peptidase [Sporosarcina sp. 179-K 3D1 HS]|uniref:C40 family peptidase n=1 Tax=Sporosarcina sp. 179-K 3D1 HS TaxID=3232169 RepID=UPI0039A3D7C8